MNDSEQDVSVGCGYLRRQGPLRCLDLVQAQCLIFFDMRGH